VARRDDGENVLDGLEKRAWQVQLSLVSKWVEKLGNYVEFQIHKAK
jgi:hypothetical protein